MAANQGHVQATSALACFYCDGEGVRQNYHETVHLFQIAANHGDSTAMTKLGHCYCFGHGAEKNLDAAAQLYKEAAKAGSPQVLCYLSECYEHSERVPNDEMQAVRQCELSAHTDNMSGEQEDARCLAQRQDDASS